MSLDLAGCIFVVEDSADLRELMAKLFEMEGFRVMFANDCETALAALDKATSLPNLVMVDLLLPGMGGVEFVSKLKADTRFMALPIAIMSGNITPEARASGAAAYVNKPFDADDLLGLAARYCHQAS